MAQRDWFKNSDFSPNEWMELLNNYLRVYYEDQDTDDMDRVYRGQEAQALKRLFDRYADGQATVDELVEFNFDYLRDVDGAAEWWDQTVSIAEADRIISTLETNPAELSNIPAPTGTKTSEYVENGALTFAGATPTTPIATVGDKKVVLRGGTGVTVDIEQVIGAGGRVFGEGGILDAVVPYIPGISLPNWMPSAGVIFLPSVGEAIDKIKDHFNSLSTGESKYFEDWDLTIYKEPLTLEKKGKLLKKMEADTITGLAYVLIELALDEQGKNLFTLEHKMHLMKKADPDLVADLATWLMLTPTKEDIKKK